MRFVGNLSEKTNLIACLQRLRRRFRMGAKYRPTIKDLKAGQRFQKQALTASKFIKSAAPKRPLLLPGGAKPNDPVSREDAKGAKANPP